MIVNPERFQDGRDGTCHSSEFRRRLAIAPLLLRN